jgi:sterol desaturase/sphingolipid hydroxylase (fatty acid hydroxylase superfamily)
MPDPFRPAAIQKEIRMTEHDRIDLEVRARSKVTHEENRLNRTRTSLRLSHAARQFAGQPSPRIIGVFLAGAISVRVALGQWSWIDAVIAFGMVAAFPLVEWVVHTAVLHWRPRRLRGITLDSFAARKHREHHADPRNVALIFLPWQVLVALVPTSIVGAMVAFPRPAHGATFLVTLGTIGLLYEWVHYLVHSDYKPKTRAYRALWRNHRFHHYKNEHYWFNLTTAGTFDRVFGTYPDPATTPSSPTAKNLHGGSQAIT